MVKLCQFACDRNNRGVSAMRDANQGPDPSAAASIAHSAIPSLNRCRLDG